MELDILERLTLPTLLPEKTNYVTAAVCRAVAKDVALSAEEQEVYTRQGPAGGLLYIAVPTDGEGNVIPEGVLPPKVREFTIGERAFELIAQKLRELDERSELTGQHVTLYEKFVVAPREAKERADQALLEAEQTLRTPPLTDAEAMHIEAERLSVAGAAALAQQEAAR